MIRIFFWIVGVVVGVIFILVIIGVGVFCFRRFFRRRNNFGGVVKVCYKFLNKNALFEIYIYIDCRWF